MHTTRCLFDVIELRYGTRVAAKLIQYHIAEPVTHFPKKGATQRGRRLAPPSTCRKHVEEMLMEKIKKDEHLHSQNGRLMK